MWGRVLQEARKAGPKKLAILAVLIAIAVLLAWGNHTTDNAASGSILPNIAAAHTLGLHNALLRP